MSTRPRLFTRVDAIAVGAIVATSVLAHIVGFAPLRRARAEQEAQRGVLAGREESLRQKEASLKTARQALGEIRTRLDAAVHLEAVSGLAGRMAAIPELAQRAGAIVAEVIPKPSVPGQGFVQVPIALSGEATYPQFAQMLAALHREFPDMEVTAFSVAGRPEVPGDRAKFTVELLWYALADNAGPAGRSARPSAPTP